MRYVYTHHMMHTWYSEYSVLVYEVRSTSKYILVLESLSQEISSNRTERTHTRTIYVTTKYSHENKTVAPPQSAILSPEHHRNGSGQLSVSCLKIHIQEEPTNTEASARNKRKSQKKKNVSLPSTASIVFAFQEAPNLERKLGSFL